MKFVCAQHIAFEPPCNLVRWSDERGDKMTVLKMFADDPLPRLNDFDGLIVMGGSMSVGDEDQYPWLKAEKELIRSAIKSDKPVLGICLGAQLIADVLGASVRPMGYREIGFYPVSLVLKAVETSRYFQKDVPDGFTAFHWHAERFEIPAHAKLLARSEACDHQAFEFGPALALQFHLEMTPTFLSDILDHCPEEIKAGGPHVQPAHEMRTILNQLGDQPYHLLVKILDQWGK